MMSPRHCKYSGSPAQLQLLTESVSFDTLIMQCSNGLISCNSLIIADVSFVKISFGVFHNLC